MDSERLEAVPPGTGHLDTVRALHQTVVSLRTALETSKNELKELKEKYEQHSHCLNYTDVIEKLTLENHILRRKIIDSGGYEGKDSNYSTPNIKLQVTYSPRSNIDDASNEVIITSATTEPNTAKEELEVDTLEKEKEPEEQISEKEQGVQSETSDKEQLDLIPEKDISPKSPELNITAEFSASNRDTEEEQQSAVEEPLSQVISYSHSDDNQPTSFKTKLELLSKFDVRIKVRTLKEGTVCSSTDSETGSSAVEIKKEKDKNRAPSECSFKFEERREHFDVREDSKGTKVELKSISSENIKMAVPNEGDVKSKADKFDVQVRITSEENLVMKEQTDRSRRKDTLNLDVDDLSLRSLSEGDNSVFSEGGITPVEPTRRDDKDVENSGNESEEVDDIELIFTTDESKDMSNLQEDLVSIRETDQWGTSSTSTHSTPVLIKFHTLDPDFHPGENKDNAENINSSDRALRQKRVSLPNDKEIKHVAFNGKGSLDLPGRGILKSCDNRSDNMLYSKSAASSARRLDSVDSLTCEYNRGLSLDNTKSSSFELGSSMDILQREESVESFHRTINFGHRFSVFAETDISKCGISEEDLAANLNRRNTCPNPFQYRPSSYRGVSRPPGPFKAAYGLGTRPVLRDVTAARRESGAQTELSALPPKWSSDGYLAYKMCGAAPSAPTVPSRGPLLTSRRLTVPDARPPPLLKRTDEARRVLLSDIGFTSMVPELSRSADPLWAGGKRPSNTDSSPASSSTYKFLSRGSSFRSPCLSIDRSNDWTPQTVYVAPSRVDCRPWRSSLPDVRHDDTDDLIQEAEIYLRRSIDNLHSTSIDLERGPQLHQMGRPYIPSEPRQLRLGHAVKVITPHGRVAVGRVRYVGIAGGSASSSSVYVGAEFPRAEHPGLPRNDGTLRGRRYFLAPPHCTALFVPFNKVVMAWAN